MTEIIKKYTTIGELSKPNPLYAKAETKYRGAKTRYFRDVTVEHKEEMIKARKELESIPSTERVGTRVYYARYADD